MKGTKRSVPIPCVVEKKMNRPIDEAIHKYRLYVYDADDRLIAPAMVISADNDDAATNQAEQMLDGVRAELRDGDRMVIRFPKE